MRTKRFNRLRVKSRYTCVGAFQLIFVLLKESCTLQYWHPTVSATATTVALQQDVTGAISGLDSLQVSSVAKCGLVDGCATRYSTGEHGSREEDVLGEHATGWYWARSRQAGQHQKWLLLHPLEQRGAQPADGTVAEQHQPASRGI
jgi:hypothetical protein